MKKLFVLIYLFQFHPALAQDDFLSVYAKVQKARVREKAILEKNQKEIREMPREKAKDTSVIRTLFRLHKKFISDSVLSLAGQVINLTFPDISFTGLNNKAYSISDFSGKDVVINYNYIYCQPCLDRIDSTLSHIKNSNTQILVLFLDKYQKESSDLKEYGDKVVIGFMNDDTMDLMSLTFGDNSMYYLNQNRQIEFFDQVNPGDNEWAWTNFLKTTSK